MTRKYLFRSTPLLLLVVCALVVSCTDTAPTPFPIVEPTAVAQLPVQTADPVETEPAPETPIREAAPTATPDESATAGPSPTPSQTPSPTWTSTQTLTPSPTPTFKPQVVPTLSETAAPTNFLEGVPTPVTAVPSPVPTFETPREITNVLLLGSDTPLTGDHKRTDSMIIVSINQDKQIASMISLPRDLYVYHPGKIMSRLNTAIGLGGVDQLRQTILYNFGIPIHYYAEIDFDGFETAVDAMGGVDIAVSCRLQDWRLISPELDPLVEENWAQFALEPGVHHMDGDMALWYARSRRSTNDFDRGRRQQQLLRAMLNQGVDLNLISEAPTLWNTYKNTVETDLDIGRFLQFVTLASAVRQNGVQNLYLARGTQSWVTPGGAQVQLPIWDGEGNYGETFSRLYRAPALNRASRPPVTVEIVNASGNPDLALLAADNLAWYGFVPIIAETLQTETVTQLEYFHPNFKDSYDWLISWIFDRRRSQIQQVNDPDFEYDYRVILGEGYDPCLNLLLQPQEFLD
ncbi:MAG: hypothetical protein GY796_10775 [Chloroflexi bacterium]|nr:hypothetical protein [Chloroflexota bacterium]